jgi:PIN domain nuclease of toxin-antitoxin system
VILLDTNALIWIDGGHARVGTLLRRNTRLWVSPATLLEIQFVQEVGKIRLKDASLQWITEDDRWLVDEPPSAAWFVRAVDVLWTRDPFDRLLVAHAMVRRWRLATSDGRILEHLGAAQSVAL